MWVRLYLEASRQDDEERERRKPEEHIAEIVRTGESWRGILRLVSDALLRLVPFGGHVVRSLLVPVLLLGSRKSRLYADKQQRNLVLEVRSTSERTGVVLLVYVCVCVCV
jgi:hypothetical protein